MNSRSKRIAILALTALVPLTGVRAAIPGTVGEASGVLEKLRPRYYATRLELRRGPVTVPSRDAFMKPYSDDTVLYLNTRGFFDGYGGAGLDRDEVVDRREAAFLLGRLVQIVEGRLGRVFPQVDHDRVHILLEPETWGHLEADIALRAGLLSPYVIADWWRTPLTRRELAVVAGRIVDILSRRVRILVYNRGEPAARFSDLHGFPAFIYPDLARALRTGVVEPAEPSRFHGKERVRGHELARTLRRLLLISQSYDDA